MTYHQHDEGGLSPEQLRAEIRQAGLRATVARVAVLGVLHRQRRPLSHSDVVKVLGLKDWDRSTLYRNLMDLADVGLLRRTELGDRMWRFEVACEHGSAEYTAHFLCTDCGAVECLPDLTVAPVNEGSIPRAISAGAIEVQLKGQCDSCLATS